MSPSDGGMFLAIAGGIAAIGSGMYVVSKLAELPPATPEQTTRTTEVKDASGNVIRTTTTTTTKE